MTAPLDEQAMRERHSREYDGRCRWDSREHPCDAIQALDALAEARRERDAERTRYVLADAGWKEMNRQVAALEADLAAMRALLNDKLPVYVERIVALELALTRLTVHAPDSGSHCAYCYGPRTAKEEEHNEECPIVAGRDALASALASSPGAAPRAPDWGGLHEFQTAEAMPAAWLATAREVVEALELLRNTCRHIPVGVPVKPAVLDSLQEMETQVDALLARAPDGIR